MQFAHIALRAILLRGVSREGLGRTLLRSHLLPVARLSVAPSCCAGKRVDEVAGVDVCPVASSETKVLYGDVTRLLAFGLEVIRHFIDTIWPLARHQPELDEAQPCAQGHKARIVAQLTHSGMEQ